jgi:hypothetical protein
MATTGVWFSLRKRATSIAVDSAGLLAPINRRGESMDNESKKKSVSEKHAEHRNAYWPSQNWRAWGSWFSWGSPVGLGLFYALIIISTGIFIWLIHHR